MHPAVAKNVYGVVINRVARADAQRHEHGELSVRARTHANRATRPGEGACGVLEGLDRRAEDEMLALDDLTHSRFDLRAGGDRIGV